MPARDRGAEAPLAAALRHSGSPAVGCDCRNGRRGGASVSARLCEEGHSPESVVARGCESDEPETSNCERGCSVALRRWIRPTCRERSLGRWGGESRTGPPDPSQSQRRANRGVGAGASWRVDQRPSSPANFGRRRGPSLTIGSGRRQFSCVPASGHHVRATAPHRADHRLASHSL